MAREGTTRRARPLMLALVTTIGLVGVSCGSGSSSAPPTSSEPRLNEKATPLEPDDPPVNGGQLVVAVPSETNGWNPNITQWGPAGQVVGPSMMEPFVIVGPEGEPEPWLVEKWTHNDGF